MKKVLSFCLAVLCSANFLSVGVFADYSGLKGMDFSEPAEETVTESIEETVTFTEQETEDADLNDNDVAEEETYEEIYLPPSKNAYALPDNDELFSKYVNLVFATDGNNISHERKNYGTFGLNTLSDSELILYKGILANVKRIADGEQASTEFTVSGLKLPVNSWDDSALKMLDYALNDCPYELYWYNKTSGFRCSATQNGSVCTSVTYKMTPASAYAGSGDYTVNTSKTGAAKKAAANAASYVNKYASYGDYEKLKAYKDVILGLVEYNHSAADDSSTPYGDPWQLIYVFDGDTSTNVVCEGYSKAFKYLCDLSKFQTAVNCYIISGYSYAGTGSGGHMWNIVTIGGKNYIVDLTNCDTGGIGSGANSLFLAGATLSSSSVTISTTVTTKCGLKYSYDQDIINLFGNSILTISSADYSPSSSQTAAKPVVTATAGNGSVTLKWNAVSGATKYAVAMYNTATGKYETYTNTLTATSYTITKLTNGTALSNGTTYQFLVQAYVNGAWNSFTTADNVKATPSAASSASVKPVVTATAGNGSVTLRWNAVAGASKYAVALYNTSTGKYTTYTNSLAATTYTVTGLRNGTSYQFLVQAYVNGDWNKFTTADHVIATPQATGDAYPVVTVTPGDGRVTLKWNAVAGATKYAVSSYLGSGMYTVYTDSLTATSYTVTGLTNGQGYEFIVQAFVNGKWTPDKVRSNHVAGRPVGPAKPVVTATAGDGKVTLKWNAVAGATKYAVSRYLGTGYTTYTNTLTATSYTVTGLTNGQTCEFLVQAYVNGKWTTYTRADHVAARPVGPAKPVVTATPGDGRVTLKWNAVSGATKYAVSRYLGNNQFTTYTNTLTATSYTVTGLTNGQTCEFLVQAYVNGKWTAHTRADHVAVKPVAPAKPVVTATAGDGRITLKWNAVPGATKYAVARYLGNNQFTTYTNTLTATSYTVTGLTNGQTYEFLVQAYVNGKWTAHTRADHVALKPVGSAKPVVTATAGDGRVTLKWNAVSGATKYAVARYLGNGQYTTYANALTSTSYTVTGLTNGQTYEFLVQAYVNGKWSTYTRSDHVTIKPVGSAKPVVTATAGDGRVTLKWNAVSGATKYAVSLYNPSTGNYSTYTNSLTTTSYTVTGLTNGTTYQFLVQAYVNGAWSRYTTSDHVKATPKGTTVTKPVVTATAGDGKVTLKWNAVSGATKYAISKYDITTGSLYTYTNSYTSTSVTINGLTNGTTYYFIVQAYVNGSWSSYTSSDAVRAIPKGTTTGSKPVVTATSSGGVVYLNWNAVSGATQYAVLRYTGNGQYYTYTSSYTSTNCSISGLNTGTTYEFAVQAYINGSWTTLTTADHVKITVR